MEDHLRLAERQGILQGRHLSVVQVQGLVLLRRCDLIAETVTRRDKVKMAMVAAGLDYEQLFPELFAKNSDTESSTDEAAAGDLQGDVGGDVTYDYSGVEWMTPTDAREEYDRLMAALAESGGGGRMSGEHFAESANGAAWGDWQ